MGEQAGVIGGGVRDAPLDALRGLAVLGMVVVNLQGSAADAFPFLTHAAWNGLTFANLVFPVFLLAVGLALPLTTDRRDPPPAIGRIVRRAVPLFAIGLALGWAVRPTLDVANIRFTGVLERIAIVYLVAALLCRATRGWAVPLAVAGGLMLLHGVLLLTPAPGEAAASMAPGMGMSGWLDRLLLPGRIFRTTWDPEGPLSTLSAIATALIGVGAQRLTLAGYGPVRVPLLGALLCAALAWPALHWWPVNKALWTPSFALVTAAIGLALLAVLRALWPHVATQGWARLAQTLGQCALTLYVVHALLTAILVIKVHGVRIWTLSFDALARTGLPPAWASLLYALAGGALSIAITLWLRRRGWVLRV